MHVKECVYDETVRICIYTVDQANLDFHRHSYLADITCCIKGKIKLELPTQKKAIIFKPWEVFQVPTNMLHRVSHCDEASSESEYVLIQLGKFSVDFEAIDIATLNAITTTTTTSRFKCFLNHRKNRLEKIMTEFRRSAPKEFNEADREKVVHAIQLCLEDASDQATQDLEVIAQYAAKTSN